MSRLPTTAAQQLARHYVSDLTFRSNVTPPINVPDPLGPDQGLLMRLVRPEVTIVTKVGEQVIAPAGAPVRGLGTVLTATAVLGVGWLAYRVFFKR